MTLRASMDRRAVSGAEEPNASHAIAVIRVGAQALGALAVGALAVGALAIGAVAIGRARIRRLEIDELIVRKLYVSENLQVPKPPSENQS